MSQDRDRGRPSLYRPQYCADVVEAMGAGHSFTAFAGMIGVSKDTLYEWKRTHPEFAEASEVAKPARLLFLERRLLEADTTQKVSSSIFALKNADPSEWREKQTVTVAGDPKKPFQIQVVNYSYSGTKSA